MKLFLIGLGLHLLVLACNAKEDGKNDKELVMLEMEPTKPDDRLKRASRQGEGLRQPGEVPPEYLTLLQQLSAQRDQSTAAQQQQYIQQLVLSKDGLKQSAPTRYILSQDGRLLEESVAFLGQTPQQFTPTPTQYTFQQQPQTQTQAQQPPLARPTVSPELAEFSRQQQRLQQEYADAPLRAQITGTATRTRQRQGQAPPQTAPPAGPSSQSPQVFLQSQQRADPRLRAPVPAESPNFVYAPVPSDAQAILQQQLAQLSIAGAGDGRQFYTQPSRAVLPQQIIYQQPTQQEFSQERLIYQTQQPSLSSRRPVPITPSPQPQTLQQSLPQQYLIETTRPQAQQPQYIPQEVQQQVQYIQPSQLVTQQAAVQPKQQQYSSTLLQPVNGRALFDPKPSRSSIYVSRSSSTARPVALGAETESQKIPVVRLPTPSDQRPLTRQELEALVNAGYAVSPVPVPIQDTLQGNYIKSKRQQPIVVEEGKNHVVYENHQDGVQYQYSPGSSTTKIKKSVSDTDEVKNTQKENSPVLTTYVLAVGNESS